METKRRLLIAKKLSHNERRYWTGYLTPTEYLYLIDVIKVQVDTSEKERVLKDKKAGVSNSQWRSFQLSEAQKSLLQL